MGMVKWFKSLSRQGEGDAAAYPCASDRGYSALGQRETEALIWFRADELVERQADSAAVRQTPEAGTVWNE